MEDEEKNVDTQTTEKADNLNADESAENEIKENADEEQNLKEDDDITKAFGNTAEKTKNEGEKVKKDKSVAKTNADGSITFKNQAELDGFINRMYNKGAKSVEQKANETKDEKTEEKEQQNTEMQEENKTLDTEGIRAKIALKMIDVDVNAKKAKRAAMLVDLSKVCENGQINEAKLKAEIDNVIAEWPELKSESANQDEKKGFVFGGSQGNSENTLDDAEISKIFGNSNN